MTQYGQAPDQSGAAPLLQVQPGTLEQLRRFAEGGYLYAILDSADQPKVPDKARELGDRAVSLFRGTAQEDFSAVAPYLVRVDPPTFDWIVENLWAEPWGVFVMAKVGMEVLRTHFRRFLIVQLPDGEKWFFRFYDPRILSPYLGACKQWEVEKFFGPVRAYALANSQGISLVQSAVQPPPTSNERATDPNASILWQVRQEQIAALDRTQFEDYRERTIKHLRESFPEITGPATDGQLREFVAKGVESAARFQIRRETDVTRFLHLLLAVTPQFENDPKSQWILQYLNDASLQAEQKLDLITERLAFAKEGTT